MRITVQTESKGGNPGGWVTMETAHSTELAYMKHVFGQVNLPDSLAWTRQPIYEAMTLELARRIGLYTPEYFVLDNRGQDCHRIESPEVKTSIRDCMPFYFVSLKVDEHDFLRLGMIEGFEEEINAAINGDAVLRDVLFLSDIVGRPQNYMYDATLDSIIYVDMGCSFVNATGGFMRPANGFKASDYEPLTRQEKKDKRIGRYGILTKEGTANSLADIISDISILKINLSGTRCRVPVTDLLHEEEIIAFQSMFHRGYSYMVSKYRRNHPGSLIEMG